MTDPVSAQHIMLATMAGALVILFGAFYAFFFAWSKLKKHPRMMIGAYVSYLLFAISTAIMAYTLNLTGFWFSIVVVMLIGYLLAPHGIWYLCEGTHQSEAEH